MISGVNFKKASQILPFCKQTGSLNAVFKKSLEQDTALELEDFLFLFISKTEKNILEPICN